MTDGFTKLFGSIVGSSIWSEDDQTRIVWITMLAMADQNGKVDASIPGLANYARVSIAATEKALALFLAPDRYSRTEEEEGRRIEKVDGGWRLLNYFKYRESRDPEKRRKQNREAQARYRSKPKVSQSKPESAQAEAEAEAEKKEVHGGAIAPVPSASDLVALWNGMAEKSGIGRVNSLSDPRKRHIKARLHDPYFVANFHEAILKIGASNFCRGLVGKGWRADFDWLIEQPNVINKIMEGKYDNRDLPSTDTRGLKDQMSIAERDLMRMSRECDARNQRP